MPQALTWQTVLIWTNVCEICQEREEDAGTGRRGDPENEGILSVLSLWFSVFAENVDADFENSFALMCDSQPICCHCCCAGYWII